MDDLPFSPRFLYDSFGFSGRSSDAEGPSTIIMADSSNTVRDRATPHYYHHHHHHRLPLQQLQQPRIHSNAVPHPLQAHPVQPLVNQTATIESFQQLPDPSSPFPSITSPPSPSSPSLDASASPSPPFVRGHRRRSTRVSFHDLQTFRREVLGWQGCDADTDSATFAKLDPANDPELQLLNSAFEEASMSLHSASGITNSSPGTGMFSSFVDNSPNTPNLANVPRQSMSPALPHTPVQTNGGGGNGMAGINAAGMPMNAGHQMDLHHLYEMVLELSEVLKNNREVTKSIVNSAEEIMKRAGSEGASPSIQQVNGEISAARIAELERALAKEKRAVEILKHEQEENTKLIGEYETAVGIMVEQIRNYCQNNNMHFLAQKRHYNNLLQAERDAHLESRLDRDYWHAQTMKCAEMIRTAYRLRCEEEEVPVRIISGLQNEVRAYRNALGMEPEAPEEEYGWEILRDVAPSVD